MPLDVAGHQERLFEAGLDVRIEPARFGVRRQRFLVETGIPARVHQAREQLRVVAVTRRGVEQADDRALGLADVGFEIGVELVRDRQLRVQLERAVVGLPGPFDAAGRRLDVLADQAIAAAQPRPRRARSVGSSATLRS